MIETWYANNNAIFKIHLHSKNKTSWLLAKKLFVPKIISLAGSAAAYNIIA